MILPLWKTLATSMELALLIFHTMNTPQLVLVVLNCFEIFQSAIRGAFIQRDQFNFNPQTKFKTSTTQTHFNLSTLEESISYSHLSVADFNCF